MDVKLKKWLKILEKGIIQRNTYSKIFFAPIELQGIFEELNKIVNENITLKNTNNELKYKLAIKHKDQNVVKLKPITRHKKVYKKPKTYLMKDKNNGLYKIGKSINPKHRERTLQSEKPNIKMVKVWNCDIERKLHNLYSTNRIRGEWFNLNKVQIEYICTHF